MVTKVPSFAVEASLGRLATHLRLLGFDAEYQRGRDSEAFFRTMDVDRIALIRTRRLRDRLPQQTWLFIRDNDPQAQVIAVLEAFKMKIGDVHPFSRCARCNGLVEALAQGAARGRVPDHVWQTQTRFSTCSQCEQVFWSGSHTRRYQDKINHWFNRSSINSYDK